MSLVDGADGARDPASAAPLCERACTGGLVNARVNLGLLLDDGEGVPGDATRAAAPYQQARDKQFEDSERMGFVRRSG